MRARTACDWLRFVDTPRTLLRAQNAAEARGVRTNIPSRLVASCRVEITQHSVLKSPMVQVLEVVRSSNFDLPDSVSKLLWKIWEINNSFLIINLLYVKLQIEKVYFTDHYLQNWFVWMSANTVSVFLYYFFNRSN